MAGTDVERNVRLRWMWAEMACPFLSVQYLNSTSHSYFFVTCFYTFVLVSHLNGKWVSINVNTECLKIDYTSFSSNVAYRNVFFSHCLKVLLNWRSADLPVITQICLYWNVE